jgi:hypothetical protein
MTHGDDNVKKIYRDKRSEFSSFTDFIPVPTFTKHSKQHFNITLHIIYL